MLLFGFGSVWVWFGLSLECFVLFYVVFVLFFLFPLTFNVMLSQGFSFLVWFGLGVVSFFGFVLSCFVLLWFCFFFFFASCCSTHTEANRPTHAHQTHKVYNYGLKGASVGNEVFEEKKGGHNGGEGLLECQS